jgi:hypothetical protein
LKVPGLLSALSLLACVIKQNKQTKKHWIGTEDEESEKNTLGSCEDASLIAIGNARNSCI